MTSGAGATGSGSALEVAAGAGTGGQPFFSASTPAAKPITMPRTRPPTKDLFFMMARG